MKKPLGEAAYVLTVLSTAKQFYTEEKYHDIQLQVDDEFFKAHRFWLALASEYFDTMFSSNFRESNATKDKPITLHELDAVAFKEIFHFIYTGEISVNDSNVFPLLVMNDFLRLRTEHVKEECIKYLLSRSQEPKPISNPIELFSFACMKAESKLVDLLSAYICEHLHHYSENALLMEMDFEHLNTLLKFSKNYILPLPGSQNVVLKIIHNWIDHDREGRAEYRFELMKNIDVENISADFALLLINRMEVIADELANIKLSSERKTLGMETKIDLIKGDARRDATISYTFENIREIKNDQIVFSSSFIVSNLSWRVGVRRSNGKLGIFLFCEGTCKVANWNCWANATFTLVSHKEGIRDIVRESYPYKFSSDSKNNWGFGNIVAWNDLNDPENGFIKDNSFLVHAYIHADVSFFSNRPISRDVTSQTSYGFNIKKF